MSDFDGCDNCDCNCDCCNNCDCNCDCTYCNDICDCLGSGCKNCCINFDCCFSTNTHNNGHQTYTSNSFLCVYGYSDTYVDSYYTNTYSSGRTYKNFFEVINNHWGYFLKNFIPCIACISLCLQHKYLQTRDSNQCSICEIITCCPCWLSYINSKIVPNKDFEFGDCCAWIPCCVPCCLVIQHDEIRSQTYIVSQQYIIPGYLVNVNQYNNIQIQPNNQTQSSTLTNPPKIGYI